MPSTIKRFLSQLLTDVVRNIALSREIQLDERFTARVEYPPGPDKGHYSTPVAMECARIFKRSPADIAAEIVKQIRENDRALQMIDKIEVVNPGFINIFLSTAAHQEMLQYFNRDSKSIFQLVQVDDKKNKEKKIIYEFVSANPTGPLNIVSARAAAVGDAICRVIKICGYNIHREYYVNDYGNQVRLLGLSLAARYLQKLGYEVSLPEEGYQGEYIKDILEDALAQNPEISTAAAKTRLGDIIDGIFQDNLGCKPGDPLTADMAGAKFNEAVEQLANVLGPLAVETLRSSHERDLEAFGVHFDRFFSEKSLHDNGEVEKAFEALKASGHAFEEDGAWLFRSVDYGDEKNRVIVRSDLRPTYLLADIAYHKSKIDRGFTHIYDIWGPDHHGYISRIRGALKALGFPGGSKDEVFEVMIVQQVNMIEEGKPVVMSKRLGKFHTMVDLLQKIPADVVRYFFLMRSQSSHLDFDLDLATTHSNKNPVYYIQYAHARICSIFREAKKDLDMEFPLSPINPDQLQKAARQELLLMLWRFPELVEQIAVNFEVQLLSEYLYNLAAAFTRFYHEKENRILVLLDSQPQEAVFLLKICQATRQVFKEGLELLGISAPEKMDAPDKMDEL